MGLLNFLKKKIYIGNEMNLLLVKSLIIKTTVFSFVTTCFDWASTSSNWKITTELVQIQLLLVHFQFLKSN